jgi:hypothetical protein
MENIIAFRDKSKDVIFLKQISTLGRRKVPISLSVPENPALHIGDANLILSHTNTSRTE